MKKYCYIFNTSTELRNFVNKRLNTDLEWGRWADGELYFVVFDGDDKFTWCFKSHRCNTCTTEASGKKCIYNDNNYIKIHMGRKQKLDRLLK